MTVHIVGIAFSIISLCRLHGTPIKQTKSTTLIIAADLKTWEATSRVARTTCSARRTSTHEVVRARQMIPLRAALSHHLHLPNTQFTQQKAILALNRTTLSSGWQWIHFKAVLLLIIQIALTQTKYYLALATFPIRQRNGNTVEAAFLILPLAKKLQKLAQITTNTESTITILNRNIFMKTVTGKNTKNRITRTRATLSSSILMCRTLWTKSMKCRTDSSTDLMTMTSAVLSDVRQHSE